MADVYNLNRIFTRTVLRAGWRLKAISYFIRAAKLRYTFKSHSAPSCCLPIERTWLINNENRCSQKETRSIELSKPSRGFVVRRCSHFRPNLATIENFCCLLQRWVYLPWRTKGVFYLFISVFDLLSAALLNTSEITMWRYKKRKSYVWRCSKRKKIPSIFKSVSNELSRCLVFGKTTARVNGLIRSKA